MPLFISSSKHPGRHWLAVWLGALALATLALAGIEWHWRAHGYRPNVLDSRQLWALQRARIDRGHGTVLALLGASRIEFGVDPKRLRERLPRYRPVMLAVNAHYPLAALRDLARDPDFRGVVVCDLDMIGFLHPLWDMQQPYVDYFHTQWTPSWRLHREALTDWQRAVVIANPDFGWKSLLRHFIEGGRPFHDYIHFYSNRSGDIDFTRTDPAATKRHFAETLDANIAALPPHDPAQWLADLAPLHDWIAAIDARGGSVIFFQSPVTGSERDALQRVFPRRDYWDRLAAAFPEAHFLDALDVPELARFPLPDDSHLDYRNKPAYTDALAETLLARGWLQR